MAEEEEEKELPGKGLEFLDDEDFLKHLLGDGLEAQMFDRPVTDAEIDYLLKRYAFLIIQNADSENMPLNNAKVFVGKNGWNIHDHGDVLRASPGRLAFGGSSSDEEGEEGEGGGDFSRSPVWQFVNVAQELIDLAIQRWGAAMIVEGYRGMQLAASVYAKEKDYLLDGFEADEGQELAMKKILELRRKGLLAPPSPEQFPG